MKWRFTLLFLFSFFISLNAQIDKIKDTIFKKNGISKPSILSTNSFGIFFMRLNHNFKESASAKKIISVSIESGNLWGPNVKTFIPKDASVRNKMNSINWFSRQYSIDFKNNDFKTFEISTDAVIKGLRVHLTIPINNKQELVFGTRAFILTKGNLPFTIITGDKFVEYFHEKIAGGNDPFDRRIFGYEKANFYYKDRNGNSLSLNNGDVIYGGVESSYYYYPTFLNYNNIFINFGGHLGANLSQYNSSIDLGVSIAGLKKVNISNNKMILFGLGLNTVRKSAINFNKENLEFGNNDFLGSLETDIEYSFVSKGKTTHSFGAMFYVQTSLNKSDEFDYAILVRDADAFNSWQNNTEHLYKNNNYWTFVYTFSRKIETSFYLQQDLTVNNHPDIQTGVGIKFNI